MITERNRLFSTILNTDKQHAVYAYRWAPSAVITGHASLITGAWAPVGASVSIPNFARITGTDAATIPIETQKYSINIISGSAYINSVGPFIASYNVNGGGYGAGLSSPIVVSGVGAGSLTYLAWET
jgi:hypothetical protein